MKRDWRKVLTDASRRGLTVRALARELGIHNKIIYDAERTYGVRLPRRDETQPPTIVAGYVADGTEQWRVIPGYERYEASNLGRIRNIKTGKMLAQHAHPKQGYLSVSLWATGATKGTTKWAHRWVALTFLTNPNGLPQVNHKDRVRTNNAVENLEWTTRAENYSHGIADERLLSRSNAKVKSKLSPEAVKEIMAAKPAVWKSRKNGPIAIALAAKYGINRFYINDIWRGEKRRADSGAGPSDTESKDGK